MIPLGLLSPGEQGEIVEVRSRQGGCSGSCHDGRGKGDVRVEDMGLRVGNRVEMLNNGGGPVPVRVDESRIAVDRGMAMKIMVRSLQ